LDFLFRSGPKTPKVELVDIATWYDWTKGEISMAIFRHMAALLVFLPLMALTASAQDYRVRPGDVLQIEVLEDPTLNRSAIVLPDGQISLPVAGTIRVSGRSLGQVQSELASRLASGFASPPTVYVTLSELAERVPATPRVIDIYVLGAANTPGKIQVSPGTTLLQAIAEAGGLSPFAAKKRVQLRRVDKSGTERVYLLDLDAVERGVAGGGTARLADGDVIVVPQRKLFE
jgi:polysaccharide export outer membrane protein